MKTVESSGKILKITKLLEIFKIDGKLPNFTES